MQSQIERARKRKFKMDFKVLAMLLFAIAAAEASVIKDLLRYQERNPPRMINFGKMKNYQNQYV